MEFAYAFLANSAEFAVDGRLYVLGGDFDILLAPSFPVILPALSLVAKFWFDPAECHREYRFRAVLTGPDGALVPPLIEHTFTPQGRPGFADIKAGFGITANLQGVVLPVPGEYVMQVLVEGGGEKTLHLRILRTPASPTESQRTEEPNPTNGRSE